MSSQVQVTQIHYQNNTNTQKALSFTRLRDKDSAYLLNKTKKGR